MLEWSYEYQEYRLLIAHQSPSEISWHIVTLDESDVGN